MVAKVEQRGLRDAILGGRLLEDGRLGHAQAHDEADDDEEDGKQKRDAPAERDHLVGREHGVEHEVHAVSAEEPDRSAEVREAAVERALALRRVLRRHERRARPLAGKPNALERAAGAQKDDRCGAEDVIPWQKTDDKCRDAHHHKCCDQGFLSSELVAEVPEQKRAERTRQKRHSEGDEGEQRRQDGVRFRDVGEEDEAEIARRRNGIAVVIVELDRGADHRRRDDLRRRVLLFLLRLCPEGQSARRCRA